MPAARRTAADRLALIQLSHSAILYRALPEASARGSMVSANTTGHVAHGVCARLSRSGRLSEHPSSCPARPECRRDPGIRGTTPLSPIEAGAPLPYVMDQVGHADSKTTLEIYAQVQKQSSRRNVHAAFDRLLDGADSSVITGQL